MAEPARKQPSDLPLYDRDFFRWTEEQAQKLRARTHNDIDWENVAEEIESLGRSERREIRSRLEVLLLHLLKWQFQPERRKGGLAATLRDQRRQLRRVLDENPSLASFPSTEIAGAFDAARALAEEETGIAFEAFPEVCPFTLEQALDPDFLPEPPAPSL